MAPKKQKNKKCKLAIKKELAKPTGAHRIMRIQSPGDGLPKWRKK